MAIATMEYGEMFGQFADPNVGASFSYVIDSENRVDISIDNYYWDGGQTPYPQIVPTAIVDGVPVYGGDLEYESYNAGTILGFNTFGVTNETYGYFWFKVTQTGRTKTFSLYVGDTDDDELRTHVLSFSLFGMDGDADWDASRGQSVVVSALPIIPSLFEQNPPNDLWSDYWDETVLDGAYGRVTLLDADGVSDTIYSNGYDGAEGLVALDLQEYFDGTSSISKINSGSFSIQTPFDKTTSEDTIATYLTKFSKWRQLFIERGWSQGEGALQTYDTVGMGYFYITEVTLIRETGILEVQFYDIFGVMNELKFPDVELNGCYLSSSEWAGCWVITDWTEATVVSNINDILTKVASLLPLNNPDLHITIDPYNHAGSQLLAAPYPENATLLEALTELVNVCGGRWYDRIDGSRVLLCHDPAIHKLSTYKINQLHTFDNPEYEQQSIWTGVPTVQLAAFSSDSEYSEVGVVPRTSSGSVVSHPFCYQDVVLYGRTGSDSSTDQVIPTSFDDKLYQIPISQTAWVKQSSPLVYYDLLVVKGYEAKTSFASSGDTNDNAILKNRYLTQHDQALGALTWTFIDNTERAYRWSMRDDPSLRCGNIVKVAVNNEYLYLKLIEAKRSFNGAGTVEYLGLYVSSTGEVAFQTEVDNPLATWLGSDSTFSGITASWDAITGYDEWDNSSIDGYRVYDTSGDEAELLVEVPADTLSVEIERDITNDSTFGVTALINGEEWAIEACVNVFFDNTADDYRYAGEFLFYAGQDRLY